MLARRLFLAAVLALVACGDDEPKRPVYSTVDPSAAGLSGQPGCLLPPPPYSGDCKVGAEQFAIACADCHGPDGKAQNGWAITEVDPPPPKPHDLTDTAYVGDLEDEYLMRVIACGGLAVGKSAYMTSWVSAMSEDQLRGLVCYVRELSGT